MNNKNKISVDGFSAPGKETSDDRKLKQAEQGLTEFRGLAEKQELAASEQTLRPDLSIIKNNKANEQKKQVEGSDQNGKDKQGQNMGKEKPKKKMSAKKKWIIVGVVVLAVAAIATGIYFFLQQRAASFTGDNITLDLSGPKSVTSGGSVTYQVKIVNQEKANLEEMELRMIYPEGFSFESADPSTDSFGHSQFVIGELKSGEEREVKIRGKIVGEAKEIKKITAVLEYKPKNLNSKYNREAALTTTISSFPVAVQATYPDKVFTGGEAEISLLLTNKASQPATDLQLEVVYPSGFEYKDAAPAPARYKNIWQIAELGGKGEQEIKITGVFSGNDNDKKEFQIKLGMLDDKTNFFVQDEQKIAITLTAPNVELSQKMNDQTDDLQALPGDTLEYKVHYKNSGQADLTNVAVETEISKVAIDEKSVEALEGKYENGKVRWDKNTFSKLAKVEPGAEGDLIFRVRVADPLVVVDLNDKDITLDTKSVLKTEDNASPLAETTTMQVKIGTKVTFGVEPHYYDWDGNQVGDGPLPPKVGKTTKFRIYVLISNTTSDVENATVTIDLPQGVAWTGNSKTSIGHMTFDSGRIKWDIGSIKAHSGTLISRVEASFDLGITPTAGQIGQYVPLVEVAIFAGKDGFTGRDIKEIINVVDSNLEKDEKAKGKGKVEP